MSLALYIAFKLVLELGIRTLLCYKFTLMSTGDLKCPEDLNVLSSFDDVADSLILLLR